MSYLGTKPGHQVATAQQIADGVITQSKFGVNVTGNGPVFNAYAGSATSLSASANTKILFNTTLFDTNSNYSTITSRFTPSVAGYYSVTARVRADIASNAVLNAQIYKNGSPVAEGSFIYVSSAQNATTVSGLVYMNGSTDYLEVYCYSASAGSTLANQSSTYFCGFLARAA